MALPRARENALIMENRILVEYRGALEYEDVALLCLEEMSMLMYWQVRMVNRYTSADVGNIYRCHCAVAIRAFPIADI